MSLNHFMARLARRSNPVLSAAMIGTTALTLGILTAPTAAFAQSSSTYSIPAGSLASVLNRFADQSGTEIIYDGSLTEGRASAGLSGTFSPEEALGRILANSGLTYRQTGARTFTLERIPQADADTVQLGPVRVEGRTGGAGSSGGNGLGSSDVTATENSGSYTTRAMTVATKMPTTIRETPRSVSVITQQQMRDQGLEGKNLEDVLRYTPGVTLDDTLGDFMQNGGVPMIGIYVRGEQVKSIQIDGVNFDTSGRGLIWGQSGSGFQNGTWSFTDGLMSLPDMSVFDHVEVVRGPNAMFSGNGSVAATVTLVRKRPLAHAQTLVDLTYGSWGHGDRDYYRATVDTTGPLALDGRLRARFLVTQRDGAGNFQKRYDAENLTLFGSLELDLTPTTLLGGGFSREKRDETGLPASQGVPRYHWGGDLNLPTDTNLANPNAFKHERTNTAWAYLEQQLGGDWLFQVNGSYSNQEVRYWSSRTASSNIYDDGSGLRVVASNYDSAQPRYNKSLNIDANVTGAFSFLDRTHQLLIGVDHKNTRGKTVTEWEKTAASGATITINNIFDFDDYLSAFPQLQLQRPANPSWSEHNRTETGLYATLKIEMVNSAHLLASARYAQYSLEAISYRHNDSSYKHNSMNNQKTIPISPNFALTWDFADQWTAYGSYAKSYVDQSNFFMGEIASCDGPGEPTCASVGGYQDLPGRYATGPGNRMAPETGYNAEIGVKGELMNGRFNVGAALFRARRENFGSRWYGPYGWSASDGWYFTTDWSEQLSEAGDQCCFSGNGNYQTSKGLELEISGEPFAGFQISGGYTYQDVRRVEPSADVSISNLHTRSPKHLFKLWTSYQPQGGALKDFRFGLGVTGQSKTYSSGRAAEYLGNDPDYVWLDSDGNPTGQKGLDIYSNMINYALNPAFEHLFAGYPETYYEYYEDGVGWHWGNTRYGTLPFDFSQKAYAIVNAMVDYKISDQFAVQLNVDNVFNRKYYRTIGTATGGNYYGASRFVSVSLRGRF